jgi:ParB family chromosome partitioning protein
MQYEFHEAANEFPMMSADRFIDLKNDIKEQGLLHAIVLHDSKVLDGRTRYKACLDLGIEPNFEIYSGSTPYCYVYSSNAQRRDISTGQRSAILVRMEPKIASEI